MTLPPPPTATSRAGTYNSKMDHFEWRDGQLLAERLPVVGLAERFSTPTFLYSHATLTAHYDRIAAAFGPLDPLICYAVKSCANLAIVKLLAERGAGADVVSGGELFRAIRAGVAPSKVVFAGVGKSDDELLEGLRVGVGLFNVESESELARLAAISTELRSPARVALRVNPDVDAGAHTYTTTGTRQNKFGIAPEDARRLFREFAGRDPHLRVCGIHQHIGSPINHLDAYAGAIQRGLELIDTLRRDGHAVDTFDIGGGLGAFYQGGEAPSAEMYAARAIPLLSGRGLRIVLEPGRAISANAGLLVTRVLHVKDNGERRFVIVDAAMNDLIRPALYGAYHFIWPVQCGAFVPASRSPEQPQAGLVRCDVVGPICESGDFFAKDRLLPPVQRGDLLAIFAAGAYGMSMGSQYNSRPRAAEVLVEGDAARLIRRRETYNDLIAAEVV